MHFKGSVLTIPEFHNRYHLVYIISNKGSAKPIGSLVLENSQIRIHIICIRVCTLTSYKHINNVVHICIVTWVKKGGEVEIIYLPNSI